MNRVIRPTAVVSLFVAAIVTLSACTTSESGAPVSVSSSAATPAQEASPAPSLTRSEVIKQVLAEYELPASEVVFTGVHVTGDETTYDFQLGEDAYQKYLLRVGRSADDSDAYVTTLEESPWLESAATDAMPAKGLPGKEIYRITAAPWVPAAGGHVPPVSRT